MENFLHELFKTYVFQTSLDIETEKIISYIKNSKFDTNRSVRNGVQTEKLLHKNTEFFGDLNEKIYSFLNISVNDILIPIKENNAHNLNYKILEMWANISNPKGFNIEHNHPGSFISGVFYLKVPKNSGKIIFRDPRPIPDWNGDSFFFHALSCNTPIEPKEKMLLLFPSWLYHRVETNNSNEERISISFNIQKYF